MVHRQVAVLQALQVAQHAVFGVVAVEHRVGKDGVARCSVTRSGSFSRCVERVECRRPFCR
jgi:hypothetical protein